jgi:hypothetical protein
MRLRRTGRWLSRGVAIAAVGVLAMLGVSTGASANSMDVDQAPAAEVQDDRDSWEWD